MSEIKALPEAQEVWDNPADMLAMWDASESKQRHECLVAGWVGAPDSVADLGCGAGRMFAAIMDCYGLLWYYGFDASTAMVQEAKRKYGHLDNAKFSVVDIFGYSSDRTYEVAVMLDVAQHQEEPVGSVLRMLELWQADRYIFSLLVGNVRERLLNSVVVAWSELFPVLNKYEIVQMHPEPSPDGSPFAWMLMEVFGGTR